MIEYFFPKTTAGQILTSQRSLVKQLCLTRSEFKEIRGEVLRRFYINEQELSARIELTSRMNSQDKRKGGEKIKASERTRRSP